MFLLNLYLFGGASAKTYNSLSFSRPSNGFALNTKIWKYRISFTGEQKIYIFPTDLALMWKTRGFLPSHLLLHEKNIWFTFSRRRRWRIPLRERLKEFLQLENIPDAGSWCPTMEAQVHATGYRIGQLLSTPEMEVTEIILDECLDTLTAVESQSWVSF